MRYKITIEYDGTKYKGWQRLNNSDKTIQAKIELLLSKLLDSNIEIHGSGRTDAGVHAYGQVAHFDSKKDIDIEKFINICNQMLPTDIVIKKMEEVSSEFHARFSAKSKSYQYKIWNSNIPSALNRKYVYQVADNLDLEAMKEAATYFIGIHDFKNFSANKTNKSTVRNIFSIDISKKEEEINLIYHGEGFLYKMVRLLTGVLIQVGLGALKPEDILEILDKENKLVLNAAPAHALYLLKVDY
ncbi:MAG: tRNA pseudouridine(38-40) synthase TruA [Vulcanibacillus sp.]